MKRRLDSSLSRDALVTLGARQANGLFCDGADVAPADLAGAADAALERLEHCFSHVANRYFFDGTSVLFDHLHGDQYAMWLYLLGNELHRQGGSAGACKKLFLLNKALHGVDAYYEVELPSVFLFVHPLGTVLGRARYDDHLLVYQRCGVGSNHDVYPTIGKHVTLRPGSSVLGRCEVGDRCTLAAESLLLDRDLPPGTVYIGGPRDHLMRQQDSTQPIWRT